jgi:hypothetical protein
MGFRPSPYNACQSFLWVEELIRGNYLDETSSFQWEAIELNLPGDPFYDSMQPWVSKRGKYGHIVYGHTVSDILSYIDDLQSSVGSSEELCKQATKSLNCHLFGHVGCSAEVLDTLKNSGGLGWIFGLSQR